MSARIEMNGAVALITMDDGKANAINPTMLASLNAAFDEAEASQDVNAIVLTGLPGKFSAGFDLKYFQANGAEATRDLVNEGGRLALRLYGLKKPLVAAVTGHAIAMGCFITQCCDYRIATAGDFKIGANETAIGMVLPEFALQLLLARVRPDRLTETAVIARLFSPEDAKAVGFVDEVVGASTLMDKAIGIAHSLAELPSSAYSGNKRLLRRETLEAIETSLA
ncbi:MAG: crotonase/enoyl-CoA hydratase family protein [Pseudomonadota bacterium]